MSKVASRKRAVDGKNPILSAFFMGCGNSRPLTSGSEASGMRQIDRQTAKSPNVTIHPDTDNEPRVRFDDKDGENEDGTTSIGADTEFPDFGEVQSNFGDRLMSANARSRPSSTLFSPIGGDTEFRDFGEVQSNFGDRLMSANARNRPSSTLFSPSLMMTETVADTASLHSDTSIDYRAPSLSLWYDDNVAGDILVQDVYVPASGLTKQTYYCCLQWNSGINGGGYCGIQDHGKGRNYIFSIWDPIGTTEKIRPIYVGPGTICEPFGGEGTGLKSWNFELGWDPDHWYTFVCRRWDQDDHTYYGLWVKHHIEGHWSHLVTVDFPVPKTYFETWTCSFLEDWEGTGHNERRVHFKNGYKRKIDESWVPFDKAVFGIVREFSSRQYADNYDSGSFEETFYLQSGGKTHPSMSFTPETVLQKPMLPEPDTLPVSCYLTSVTEKELVWEIPSGSVPQFQYIVKIDGEFYKQDFSSEVRMCRIECTIDESVELLIEDLYGKISRIKYLVKEGREKELRMTKSAKLLLNQTTMLEEDEDDILDDIPDDGATDAETLITGVTTPFRSQSAGATTLFTDMDEEDDGSEINMPVEYGLSEQEDRGPTRTGTGISMETAKYPLSPVRDIAGRVALSKGRRKGYTAMGRSGTAVTLETPMFPASPDGKPKHIPVRRRGARFSATTETAIYPSSPGGPSTYATSAKGKARTNFTTDTEMYPLSSDDEVESESGKTKNNKTYKTSETAIGASTNGDKSPYPVSEKGQAKTYQTMDTVMIKSSSGDQSPYPASERGRAKTFRTNQTTDTGVYPSSAGGTLYPASEAGATTMYATSVEDYQTVRSVDDYQTERGTLGYATSEATTKYYTTEGETTEYQPTSETDNASYY